ncbi:MAG: glycosyltransferase family 39 protein [Gemmataceae bacterium]|nr:glycosyltransferase family 39 protein [Gemmataceae bacterium]
MMDATLQRPALSDLALRRLLLVLVAIGLLWRTGRYLLAFPIWGDEAMLLLNVAWHDYGTLATRLDNCQIAPLLFLWGQRLALQTLGHGELAMRLMPFVAGVAALFLHWRLASRLLDPLPRLFAVGFLAVAIWPVSMSALAKPYSFDLLMALLLLVPAAEWLHDRNRTGWLVLLALAAPVAMLGSYPAAFAGGAAGLALLVPAWRGGWRTRGLLAAYGAMLLAGFAAAYVVGSAQLATLTHAGIDTREGMARYWAAGLPPGNPLSFLRWLLLGTTGQMAAYPVGDSYGGSSVTAFLACVGGAALARSRRWPVLVLLAAPVALNLVAAMMGRYPYGSSCRLAQALAPGICLLAGLGTASLVARSGRWTLGVAGLFALIGLGGLARDALRPYRSPGDLWSREVYGLMGRLTEGAPVVVCGPRNNNEPVFVWHWSANGSGATFDYELPQGDDGLVWGACFGEGADAACERLGSDLARRDPRWRLAERQTWRHVPTERKDEPLRADLFRFVKDGGAGMAARPRQP